MKHIIFILTLGLLSCSNPTDKYVETKSADTLLKVLAKSQQIESLLLLSADQKQKEREKLKSNREFPFDSWLTLLQDKDSIRQCKLQMDSLINIFGQTKNTNIPFSPTDKWRLANFVVEGWVSILPSERTNEYSCFFSIANKYSLTSSDIFEIFELSNVRFPLNNVPIVIGRNAPFNGKWTAILPNKEYLVIRLVYSYPDGNITSMYNERLYFFKKIVE